MSRLDSLNMRKLFRTTTLISRGGVTKILCTCMSCFFHWSRGTCTRHARWRALRCINPDIRYRHVYMYSSRALQYVIRRTGPEQHVRTYVRCALCHCKCTHARFLQWKQLSTRPQLRTTCDLLFALCFESKRGTTLTGVVSRNNLNTDRTRMYASLMGRSLHLFICCPLAKIIWCIVRIALIFLHPQVPLEFLEIGWWVFLRNLKYICKLERPLYLG
jgi:hypothetical protein